MRVQKGSMRLSPLAAASLLSLALVSGCKSSSPIDDDIILFEAGPGPVAAGDAQTLPSDAASLPTGDAAVLDAALDAAPSAQDAALDAPPSSGDAGLDAASAADASPDAAVDGGIDAAVDASTDGGDAAQGDAGQGDAGQGDGSQGDASPNGDASQGDAGQGDAGNSGNDAGEPQATGPYAVGTVRVELTISPQRTIPVQLWYPAVEAARAEAAQGHPTAEFEPAGARRDQLVGMLAKSPDACTNKTMHAAHAPAVLPRSAPFPALVFSHCQDCVRFSTFSLVEHLVSKGFVVAAPDHVNGTIYDGTGLLDEAFLQVRANDARKVIDMLLDAQSSTLPQGLRGKIDAARIGMFGHSYGSLTTGRTLRDDVRVKAASLIAAPIDLGSPLNLVLPSAAEVAKLKQPSLFFAGLEDSALFTTFIDDNFTRYAGPTWMVQVKDAGHWSFTDIAGFNGTFTSGCGIGTRQGTLFDQFTFVDIVKARNLTKAYLAAFFQLQLLGDTANKSYLDKATPADLVTIEHRN